MNVLAVRQDNNGDVLLAGPALRALAHRATRVTLVCGPSGKAAAELLPGVTDVRCFEAGWIEANPQAVTAEVAQEFVADITGRNIERAVIFTSFHQSPLPMALLLRLAGVPWIAAISEDYAGSLLDLRHRGVPDDVHEVERALSLAAAAGFQLPADDDRRLALRASVEHPLPALRATRGAYIVVHPGATVPARSWSVAANAELVRTLAARGETVVVTGSAAERELCAAVAGDHAIDLAGVTNFGTLGRVIADAAAIVVGNTGAAHVAAAVGTPTVSLFAPTIPAARFRPWMVDHVLLGDQEIACRGCRARVCPRGDQACLADVRVADVVRALDAVRRTEVAA